MKKHIIWLIGGMLIIIGIYFFPKEEELPIIKNDFKTIEVHIDGAIKKPGYYMLPDGAKMIDLIDLAGGLKENADVNDIHYLEIINKASYEISFIVEKEDINVQTYNLNTITFQELTKIPNITETRAINILLYRQTYNQFHSLDELLLVKGIGDATFEKIKPYFII